MGFSTESAWDGHVPYYKRWGSDNDYAIQTGQFALPVAGTEPDPSSEGAADWSPVVVVQAHAPVAMRKLSFMARKEGEPPVIPDMADAGKFTFLTGAIHFNGPQNGSTLATFNWEVQGEYVFVQDCRFNSRDGFVLSGFPFPLSTQYDSLVSSSNPATVGPVVDAGQDVINGYSQALQIDFSSPYWSYSTPTYFPGVMLNADIAIGGLPAPA